MAWLQSTPEKSEKSRFKQLQGINEDHPSLDLPPVDLGAYLLGYLQELDFCMKGESGMSALSFFELSAWQDSTDLRLSSWEILALKHLSGEYVNQLHRSRDPDESAPYQTEDLPRIREAVQNFFSGLSQRYRANDGHSKPQRKGQL